VGSEPDHNYRVRGNGGIMLTGKSKYLERNLPQCHFVRPEIYVIRISLTSCLSVNAARVGHEGVCPPRLRALNDGLCFSATLIASFNTAVGVRYMVALYTYISDAVHLHK
jgi:hypothetical protein